MSIIAIIPARSGSKRIPDKNIKDFKGYPLFYWSVKFAVDSGLCDQIVFASDSEQYLEMCQAFFGNKVKLVLRPADVSKDDSTDTETFQYILKEIKSDDDDIIIHLRPTFPIRSQNVLKEALEKMKEPSIFSVRTVCKSDICIPKYYLFDKDGHITSALNPSMVDISEPENRGKQFLPVFYKHNGDIDVTTAWIITKACRMTTRKGTYGIIDDIDIDIDDISDFDKAMEV